MVPKWLFVVALGVISLGIVMGAPRAIQSEQDLRRSVVEFLTQDKEFLTVLERATSDLVDGPVTLTRHRRQSEVDEMGIDSLNGDDAGQSEGFFDRAAKFVVDLLQRFLKWINTSDN